MTASASDDPARLVRDPSIGAVLYQSRALTRLIESILHDPQFPSEAQRIAWVFWALTDRIGTRLEAMLPWGDTPALYDPHMVRRLAHVIHELHASLRYLSSSDPSSTPPSVQFAVSDLVRRHVTPIFGSSKDEHDVVVLVRPQWKYNFKFVDLMGMLRNLVNLADLEPNANVDDDDLHEFLLDFWAAQARAAARDRHAERDLSAVEPGANTSPPRFAAVVSFSALDRDDPLLYPLLAHEVGHFIDLCSRPVLHERAETLAKLELAIQTEQLREMLTAEFGADRAARDLGDTKAYTYWINRWQHVVHVCLAEVTADLLATRMMGPAFFLALAELLKTMAPLGDGVIALDCYPDLRLRLRYVWDELRVMYPDIDGASLESLFGMSGQQATRTETLQRAMSHLRGWLDELRPEPRVGVPSSMDERMAALLTDKLPSVLPRLHEIARETIPSDRTPALTVDTLHLVEMLEARLPPFVVTPGAADDRTHCGFAEILTAAWLYQFGSGESREESMSPRAAQREYRVTSDLVFKALELDASRNLLPQTTPLSPADGAGEPLAPRGAVSGPTLRASMLRHSDRPSPDRLVVVPPFGEAAINAASLELHLGHWFRTSRRSTHKPIDLFNARGWEYARRVGQEEVYVRGDGTFTLPPGGFALSTTIEYVAVPHDMMAYLASKASLGRAGLIVTTAGQVSPGFKGCFVLELVNAGDVPLVLRPFMPIAQLVFHRVDQLLLPEQIYQGQFCYQVRP